MNDIHDFFESRRRRSEPMVLATVVETRGSTYSKSGERLIIDADGVYRGLLSGGCLEGDLGIRAQQVIESGQPALVVYDLAGDDDELWGMGIGCDGCLTVFLQPLFAEDDYQPFASVLDVLRSDAAAVLAAVVESSDADLPPGAALLKRQSDCEAFGVSDDLATGLQRLAESALSARRSGVSLLKTDAGNCRVHCALVEPPPRLLVLGAGPDAVPLVRLASELGWRCSVFDHRPAYIENSGFSGAESRHTAAASALDETLDLRLFDRAVIMSHHLASDREYLRQLAATDLNYIGLLGPPARRDRLLGELGDKALKLDKRLHAPAGLRIRARGPAAIALSIVAEIQQVLH